MNISEAMALMTTSYVNGGISPINHTEHARLALVVSYVFT
jgi:prolyl-tRNA editing enzyme YbaK/EbsC (Cys-tRNA(Pro) deacylase)